jgi:glutamate-1-semialdehyde 2,1-aminomutase
MLTPGDYVNLSARVATFADNLSVAIASTGLFAVTPVAGPLMGLYLSRTPFAAPTNFDETKVLCENGLYGPFFHAMLDRGVALAPGAYEILFVSLAHSEDDLARTVELAAESAKVVARS